jgi:hypothetical protein
MTPSTYETALLALASWQAAKSDNIDEILAIACVFRNRVLKYGKSYSQILEEAEVNQGWPDIRHPVLINPVSGLLAQIDGIYRNETADLTSNHLHKNGALYFGRVVDHQGTGDDFELSVLQNQEEHPLIGTWGQQQFYE